LAGISSTTSRNVHLTQEQYSGDPAIEKIGNLNHAEPTEQIALCMGVQVVAIGDEGTILRGDEAHTSYKKFNCPTHFDIALIILLSNSKLLLKEHAENTHPNATLIEVQRFIGINQISTQ